MSAFVTAGAGFLIAVLWFDLMFDVQAARRRGADLPEDVLASIAGYYRRVTTSARPMNRLVALAMVATVAAVVLEITDSNSPAWVGWSSLGLSCAAVSLAGLHTVPNAVRLGSRAGSAAAQSAMARAILRDHLCCLAAISSVLALQLSFA